jgi:hypothetical protein
MYMSSSIENINMCFISTKGDKIDCDSFILFLSPLGRLLSSLQHGFKSVPTKLFPSIVLVTIG